MKTDLYRCPLCQQGRLSQMILMDAWSCGTCRHMFEWDAAQQRITTLDHSPPLSWHWNTRFWQRGQQPLHPLTWVTILFSIAIASLPSILIGVAGYIFPPLPNSPLAWFPIYWAGVALIAHTACVCWLLAESYQFPLYIGTKMRLRRFFSTL